MEPKQNTKPRVSPALIRFAAFCACCVVVLTMTFWPASQVKQKKPLVVKPKASSQSSTHSQSSAKPNKPLRKQTPPQTNDFVKNELLVKFKSSTPYAQRIGLVNKLGASNKTTFRSDSELYVVQLPTHISVTEAVAYFSKSHITEYAEPNYLYRGAKHPNDPSFDELWGLQNLGQNGGQANIDINATDAWNVHIGNDDIVIGVVDTGVDYTHPDLVENMWVNPNEIAGNDIDDDNNGWVDDIHGINAIDGNGDPMDDWSHGTHVAGTIAARGNDGNGVVGVMWKAKIIACKFLSSDSSGSTADAITCLEYFSELKDAGVNIVATNNSWGGGGFSLAMADAIENHRKQGILYITSAGNNGTNIDISPAYPASYELQNVITVAAYDRNGDIADFSNYGPTRVNIAAPGVSILSTTLGGTWAKKSGTSMAAPHVTGMVGLIKANQPELTSQEIKDQLFDMAIAHDPLHGLVAGGRRAHLALPRIDSDEDLMPDHWELSYGLNPNDPNDAIQDRDNDGLSNIDEFLHETHPLEPDTDNDGLTDADEINRYRSDPLRADTDEDGLSDFEEIHTYHTNLLLSDSDGDGLNDAEEVHDLQTNPNLADSDGDHLDDAWEITNNLNPGTVTDKHLDSDDDGLTDREEYFIGTSPRNSDSDGDTLSDFAESRLLNTDPTKKDSDADRTPDNWELRHQLDPRNAFDAYLDSDNDTYINLVEFIADSDPNDPNSLPVSQQWQSFHGNAQNNRWINRSTNSKDFSIKWRHGDNTIQYWKQVLSADGQLYYQTSDTSPAPTIKALSTFNGSPLWQQAVLDTNDGTSLAIFDDKLYLATQGADREKSQLNLFSTSKGERTLTPTKTQSYTADHIIATNDGVYLSSDSSIIKQHKSSGAQLWTYTPPGQTLWSAPAIDGRRVITFDGQLRILSSDNSQPIATIDVPEQCQEPSHEAPVIHSNLAAVTTKHCVLLFDIRQEVLLWSREISANGVIIHDTAVLAKANDTIMSLALNTGHTSWEWAAPAGNLHQNMVSTLSHVFVSDWQYTYAIHLFSQKIEWRYDESGYLSITDDGALIIASSFGITAIDIQGDSDNDQLPNWWETYYSLDPSQSQDANDNPDGDELTNLEEYYAGTSPVLRDTDFDGLRDHIELNDSHTSPILSDTDGDGLSDRAEYEDYRTDPNAWDSDGDLVSDGDEVNVFYTTPLDSAHFPDLIHNTREFFAGGFPTAWRAGEGSHTQWVLDTEVSSQGIQSIRSGDISHNQHSSVEWSEHFYAGDISFDALVSAEACCDTLKFYIDGELRRTLSTNSDWQNVRVTIGSGHHTLRWEYSKDHSDSKNDDSAWIDNIKHTIPSPFASTGANIILSDSSSLFEISSDGNMVRAPLPIPNRGKVRDLTLTADRQIAFADREQIHFYHPISRQFTSAIVAGNTEHITATDAGIWLTNTNIHYGIIQLKPNRQDSQHFAGNIHYGDIAHNSAGEIYALVNQSNEIHVYSPTSLSRTRHIRLPSAAPLNAFAVAADDSIYAVNNHTIYHFFANGDEQSRFEITENAGHFTDMDMSAEGKIVMASGTGNRIFASIEPDLSNFTVFAVDQGDTPTYANLYVAAISMNGTDTDNDGLPDWWEKQYHLNPHSDDDAGFDPDEDGLTNLEEFYSQTQPGKADSDNDGLTDGAEVFTYQTNPLSADTDGDLLTDHDEVVVYNSSPTAIDSDGDGLSDYEEIATYATSASNPDSDQDSIPDNWEILNDLDPTNARDSQLDSDGDGLSNEREFSLNTNILLADSDFDGLSDHEEVELFHSNPSMADSDGDGRSDAWEVKFRFNPVGPDDIAADRDQDGYSDLDEYYAGSDPTSAFSWPHQVEWRSFKGGGNRSSYLAIDTNEANFALQWQRQLDTEAWLQPNSLVVGFDDIILNAAGTNETTLYKLHQHDGSVAWQVPTASAFVSTPTMNDDTVYMAAGNYDAQHLYGIHRDSGEVDFVRPISFEPPHSFASVVGNQVYLAGDYNSKIGSFDAQSGEHNWSSNLVQHGWMMAADDRGIYAYLGNEIKQINPKTGFINWTVTDTNFSSPPEQGLNVPVIGTGHWLFVLQSDRLLGINTLTGAIQWESPITDGISLAYSQGVIYGVTPQGFHGFDANTGEQLWQWDSPDEDLTGHIALTKKHLFVTSADSTFAISLASQHQVWHFTSGGAIAISPEGKLIIVDYTSTIYAISLVFDSDQDGMPNWWENRYQLDPFNPSDKDSDEDGDNISNLNEFKNTINPRRSDSDADGLSDYDEVFTFNTNPRLADTDHDRVIDYDEIHIYESKPLHWDSDADGYEDSLEIHKGTDPNSDADYPAPVFNWAQGFDNKHFPEQWHTPEHANSAWVLTASGEDNASQKLQSGNIQALEQSIAEWEDVFIGGTLSFSYRVISTEASGHFAFGVNGETKLHAGNTDQWQEYSLDLEYGAHLLSWGYYKNAMISHDSDGVLIDNITYTAHDRDQNGIADYWEEQYAILFENSAPPHQDSDGDGISNIEEFIAGTDPSQYDEQGQKVTNQAQPNTPSSGGGSLNYLLILLLAQLYYKIRRNRMVPKTV